MLFVLFACIGGAGSAVAAHVLGGSVRANQPVHTAATHGIAITSLVFGYAGLLGAHIRPPSRCWLVPRSWHAYGRDRFAAAFGFILGLGWMTRVGSIAYWLLLATCFVQGSLFSSLLLFAVFGLVRATPLLLISRVRANGADARTVRAGVDDANLLRAAIRSRGFRVAHDAIIVAFAAAVVSFAK
jgi:hypothetical protein